MWHKNKPKEKPDFPIRFTRNSVEMLNVIGGGEKDRYTLLLTDIWLKLDEIESALKQDNDSSDSGHNRCNGANDSQGQ